MEKFKTYLFWMVSIIVVGVGSISQFLEIELPLQQEAMNLPVMIKFIIVIIFIIFLIWSWPFHKKTNIHS